MLQNRLVRWRAMPQKAIPSATLLATIRNYLGLSQVQLAAYLGISRGQVAHVEAGRRLLHGKAKLRLHQLMQLLPLVDVALNPDPIRAPQISPDTGMLRRRLAWCSRQAAAIHGELEQLQVQVIQAHRWQQLRAAWLSSNPSGADEEAHTIYQQQLLTDWTAAAEEALRPKAAAKQTLLSLRIRSLEAEARALREILTPKPLEK